VPLTAFNILEVVYATHRDYAIIGMMLHCRETVLS